LFRHQATDAYDSCLKEIAKHGSLVREAKQTLEEIFVFNKE